MVARALWSPSRIKSALQCGRRLQGMEEGWERVTHIRALRGRAVHKAVESWESSERIAELVDVVADAWWDMFADQMPAGFEAETVLKPVLALWQTEAELRREEQKVLDNLNGVYKSPKASKEYKTGIARLPHDEVAAERVKVEQLVNAVDWPWETDRGTLVEGLDHSLETTRRGIAYLADLWPNPDIVGAEWDLTSDLGNGYRVHGFIDRVEASDGIDVTDYKSSRFQDTVLDHFLQAATYAVLAEDHMGFPPDRVRLAYLRDQDSDVFEVKPGWRDRLRTLVAAADAVLEGKAFAPTFAGCGICDFFPICAAEFDFTPIEVAS